MKVCGVALGAKSIIQLTTGQQFLFKYMMCSSGIKIMVIVLLSLAQMATGCSGLSQNQPIESNVPANFDYAKSYAPAYYYFFSAQSKLQQGDIPEAIWHLEKAIENDRDSAYLKIELANLLMTQKETEKALRMVQQVLSDQPDHLEALLLSGTIYQMKQEFDKAKDAYEKVLRLNASDQNVYLALGRLYWNENDLDNAQRVFEAMVSKFPDSYAAHYFQGKALAAQGKLAQAEDAFKKSLELEPSLEGPRYELIKLYEIQNHQDKIPGLYKEILAFNPENHKALLDLALYYHQIEKDGQARRLLGQLARRSDDDDSVLTAIFEGYLEDKQYENAAWILEAMLRENPGNTDLNYLAGISHDGLEQDEQALKHMLKVKPSSRFYSSALMHGALLYHDMGQTEKAIAQIQRGISQEPDNAEFYLYLGSFYEDIEKYQEALTALQKGLDVESKNDRLHFRMGVVYDKMGRRKDSIEAMKKVVQIKPDDAEALNYLGYTYADMGIQLDEAEQLIQTALKIKPDDGYITDSLGWVYFKREQYSEALKWLNKAVQMVPDDPVILEHLGDVHSKMHSKEKALIYYRRSLEKDPKDPDSLKEKIRILNKQKIK